MALILTTRSPQIRTILREFREITDSWKHILWTMSVRVHMAFCHINGSHFIGLYKQQRWKMLNNSHSKPIKCQS